MFDDIALKIIDVDDKRINRLNDRFVRYLLRRYLRDGFCLLKLGMEMAQIVQASGLSEEEIRGFTE